MLTQVPFFFLLFQVGGVTHTDNLDKTVVSFFLQIDEPSDSMLLDLNVVQTLTDSTFYYSQYTLNAVDVTTEPSLLSIQDIGELRELTVTSLAVAAGISETLKDPNETFTLLAPVNAAFDALPSRVLTYLAENPELLEFVLLGHLIEGSFSLAEVTALDGESVQFSNGGTEEIEVTDDGVFIGMAEIVEADIEAGNGLIHLMSRVLGVPTFSEAFATNSEAVSVRAAFSAAGISLDTLFNVTIFAPTISGLVELSTEFPRFTSVFASPAWVLHLRELLFAHILQGTSFSADLEDGQALIMSNGDEFTVENFDGLALGLSTGPFGSANAVQPDILTTQGVIHLIDQVLLPNFLFTAIVDVVESEFPTMFSLVEMTNLQDSLRQDFDLTCKFEGFEFATPVFMIGSSRNAYSVCSQ